MYAHDAFYLAAVVPVEALIGLVWMFAFVLLHFFEPVCCALLQPRSRYPSVSVTHFTTPFYLFSILFSFHAYTVRQRVLNPLHLFEVLCYCVTFIA